MIPDEPTSFLAISDFTWDSIAGNVFLVKKAMKRSKSDSSEDLREFPPEYRIQKIAQEK